MASLVSRLVASLVAVVAVLQLVHLVLLNQLEERRLEELHHLHTQSVPRGRVDNQPSGRLDSINNGLGLSQPEGLSLPWSPHRSQSLGQNDLQNVNMNMNTEPRPRFEDVGGEFRILFDVVGPWSEYWSGGTTGGDHSQRRQRQRQNDFVIEEEKETGEVETERIEEGGGGGLDVTLVTQSDERKMRSSLIPLIERWKGPLSLSLWVENGSEVESALGFIVRARACHELTKRFVSFHLVFPLSDEELRNKTKENIILPLRRFLKRGKSSSKLCQTFFQGLGKDNVNVNVNSGEQSLIHFRSQPINLLRNIGRKRVWTRFSLVSDIDLIPSSGLRTKFQRFVQGKQEFLNGNGDERKTVFVVPAFELSDGGSKTTTTTTMPETKTQLLKLIEKYQARPFYFDLCWKCQVHTDYEAWEREPSRAELSVLFEVLWKDPWEPFFISDNSIPLFDERFRQYGFNRLSQLCELHMGGYKFAVLNDAFLIHKGYEIQSPFHAGRAKDLELNRAHFRQFKNEMRTKYPHSTRRCY